MMLAASQVDDLAPLIFVPLIIAVALLSIVWHFSRSKTLLERWAIRNGLRLISSEYRWLRRGPFWWRTSKGQSVYRVEVIDPDDAHHFGYVRVGGWWFGLWSDVADVIWDDVTSPSQRGFPVVVPPSESSENRNHG